MLQEREQRIADLERERQAKLQVVDEEEDDTSDPYVDHKKLNKKLARVGQSTQSEIQKAMEIAKQSAKQELKQEMWMDNHKDFYDVMKLADKFANEAPELAEGILEMPEGFERQKLVYNNIKRLGLDKPPTKESSIQGKIDSNRQTPYYQPSGVGSSPYNMGQGDFSQAGQKAAYEKIQQLKQQLRLK